ncbi:MAG TPA: AraC family transcriptional regulator [Vicinamibacterales bacterium]|nr:AraC family transcriptional regulator [Vicinamibacterales bacterium]
MHDRTHYWHAAFEPGISCLHAAFTRQEFAPHSHDAIVVAATVSGHSFYTSRGRSSEATSSTLLVFNPAEPHAGHMRGSGYWEYRAFYLTQPALQRLLPTIGLTRVPGFVHNEIAHRDLIQAFIAAHRECEAGDPAAARERLIDACGRLFAHGRDAADATTGACADRTAVDRALATIAERFNDRLTVDALAAAAGVSPFHLIRQFNRHTGMTPHAHIVRARMHDAIRRLRRGAALSDAAVQAGFYDQSGFTHHFRRAYGITPGQYVKAHAASRRA